MQWATLEELRKGAVFETEDGILAVKSEYRYPDGAPQCVLLSSGEYAHFPDKGETPVKEIDVILPEYRTNSHISLVEIVHASLTSWRGQKAPYDIQEVEMILFCFRRLLEHQGIVDADQRALLGEALRNVPDPLQARIREHLRP